MEYSIKEIAGIIGADAQKLYDAPVSILLTDSRRLSFPEQSLFFALQTKTNDGHNYIQGLYKLRVRNFVVSTFLPEFESMPEANFLVVKDTLKALQKLAAHHRKRFNIPVIGITGSNGKTIVKEFLYQLLHNEFNIVRSPRSYNSQLGVPLSVWQMSDKNTLGIFEAGISQPDEMERLQPIIARCSTTAKQSSMTATMLLSPTASSRPACPTKQSLGVGQTRKPLCISSRSRNWIPKPLSAARF